MTTTHGGASRAHPRSRGENSIAGDSHGQESGSSPLTRGKRNQELIKATGAGLIPAHAGKTLDREGVGLVSGAHPRSRGENGHPERRVLWKCGSSPLTRGKPMYAGDFLRSIGLIPAHAGKTRSG